MKTYEQTVAFHGDLTQHPIWETMFRRNIDLVNYLMRIGRMTRSEAIQEFNRLYAQSGAFASPGAEKGMVINDPKASLPLARSTVHKVRECASVWVDPDLLVLPDVDPDESQENPGLPGYEHLPFPDGAVMLFGKEVETRHPLDVEQTMALVGAVWFPVRVASEPGSDEAVWKAVIYSIIRNDAGMLEVDLSAIWSFDSNNTPTERSRLLDPGEYTDAEVDAGANQSRMIAGIMRHLAYGSDEDIEKTSVAVMDASGDKGAKRAAKKRNVSTDVNVIYLNRNKRSVIPSETAGDGKGVRRHMVRAFWRRQPYGPKRALRKWVLVKAHERGSAGPTDDRPKVYADRSSA